MFQSLFQWILLANIVIDYEKLLQDMFQSLFQWILLANIKMLACKSKEVWFQSLFQWILLANLTTITLFHSFGTVSILVLVDLARELLSCDSTQAFRTSFQSLFQWILLANSILKGIYQMKTWSFNPCFSGSCSRMLSEIHRSVRNTDVSILVLVDLARECY